MNIEEITSDPPRRDWAATEIGKWPDDWTRKVAGGALYPAPGARILIATIGDHLVGIASFRIEEAAIKRINTATWPHRMGVGAALVKAIIRLCPDLPMWTKSDPRAHAFCRSLGMEEKQPLEDGRIVFRWSTEQARQFAA